jgi:hypothetical protein
MQNGDFRLFRNGRVFGAQPSMCSGPCRGACGTISEFSFAGSLHVFDCRNVSAASLGETVQRRC